MLRHCHVTATVVLSLRQNKTALAAFNVISDIQTIGDIPSYYSIDPRAVNPLSLWATWGE
jgi:hypothetical protein